MKRATDFLAHIDLTNLFEVFIIPNEKGMRFQFFAYSPLKEDFPNYLATRFSHLGAPADCTYHEEIQCYDVLFEGLRFEGPEDALRAITERDRPKAGELPS